MLALPDLRPLVTATMLLAFGLLFSCGGDYSDRTRKKPDWERNLDRYFDRDRR